MKIKVCGMTELGQLQRLKSLGADYAGLIFYAKSPRYAAEKLRPVVAEVRRLDLPTIGVFVNADQDFIREKVEQFGLSAVQLHGDESPEFCRETAAYVPVIKAIRMAPDTELGANLEPFETVETFLLDTDSKQYGGSGKKFDWSRLQSPALNKPFLLSGGIGPEDRTAVKELQHPHLLALDLNSRFETAPGIKDLEALKLFIKDVKKG